MSRKSSQGSKKRRMLRRNQDRKLAKQNERDTINLERKLNGLPPLIEKQS